MDEKLAAELKGRARSTWAAGNFDAVAELIWGIGETLVDAAAVSASDRVLDIACGTGNVAIPAAERGARIVAADLTPQMFEAGRRRAAEAGVEIEWVEADAEALPFEDASFDVVLSSFGIMFAPRHAVAAREAARVLAPGGRLAFCCWRPDGNIGKFFITIAGHMPPPPEGFEPPPLWGVREHVTDLFAGSGVELSFSEGEVDHDFESPEQALEFYATNLGPMVEARAALEPEGRWQALAEQMIALFERESEPHHGGIRFRGQYLLIRGHRPG